MSDLCKCQEYDCPIDEKGRCIHEPLCKRINHLESALKRLGSNDEFVDSERKSSFESWVTLEMNARFECANKVLEGK